MDDGFRNLEDFVPLRERHDQGTPFQIGETSSETIIRRLRLTVPTGMVSISNERLRRSGSSLFYNTRCVGSSYQNLDGRKWFNWKSSFIQMLLDLEAPDTVVRYTRLSGPLVVALSTLYLGAWLKLRRDPDAARIVNNALKFLADNSATASIIALDEHQRAVLVSYIFKGRLYGSFRTEENDLVSADLDAWDKISAGSRIKLSTYILSQENLSEGYGIDFLTPGEEGGGSGSDERGGPDSDEGGGSKVGARKTPRKPTGESSIALELPKHNEEDAEAASSSLPNNQANSQFT